MKFAAGVFFALLFAGSGALGCPQHLAKPADPKGYVLRPSEGETRLLGPRRAPLAILVSPSTGSPSLTSIKETIAPRTGIPIHLHEKQDEIIFIHRGIAIVTIDGEDHRIEAGGTAYVPRMTWHGMRNDEPQEEVVMIATYSAPGMDDYFREFSTAPGEPSKTWTGPEMAEISRKHGMRYQPPGSN